jgi:hypothetical protein
MNAIVTINEDTAERVETNAFPGAEHCKAMRQAGQSMAGADSAAVTTYKLYAGNKAAQDYLACEFRVGYYMKRFGVSEKAARLIEGRKFRPTDASKVTDDHKSVEEMQAFANARKGWSRVVAFGAAIKPRAPKQTEAKPVIKARMIIETAKTSDQLLTMLQEIGGALKATYDANAKLTNGDDFAPWRALFTSKAWLATKKA